MTSTQTPTAELVTNSLPTPSDRPGADVMIYDGDCRFCTAGAKRIAGWDRGGRVAFLSLHDPVVAARYPDLTHDMLMEELYIVDRHGHRHAGASAFRYLTRRLPRLWLLAPLMHIPFSLPLWKWGYRQVAQRRYKIAGKNGGGCDGDACAVHFK